jgi:hypothetical protein
MDGGGGGGGIQQEIGYVHGRSNRKMEKGSLSAEALAVREGKKRVDTRVHRKS